MPNRTGDIFCVYVHACESSLCYQLVVSYARQNLPWQKKIETIQCIANGTSQKPWFKLLSSKIYVFFKLAFEWTICTIQNRRYNFFNNFRDASVTPFTWKDNRLADVCYKSGTFFLRVIYAILNASVILERNKMRLARSEKRLTRNETRGGNLPLSGTVWHLIIWDQDLYIMTT